MMKFEAAIGENNHEVTLSPKEGTFSAGELSGEYIFEFVNGRHILRIGTKTYKIDNVQYEGSAIEFTMNGVWHSVSVKDEQELLLDRLGFKSQAATMEGMLNAPMPGKILEIMVKEGDKVEKGQPLAILEAMKMENELKSPVTGTIAKISAGAGQSLEKNSPILEIKTIG
ncbi:MAG: biotin/lipoyl-containing protein [Balneolaceae bacterium]